MTDTTQFGESAPAAPVEVTAENVDQLLKEQENEGLQTQETEAKEVKKEEPKVNLGALHEERARRKALEAEKRQLTEQIAQIQAERAKNEQMIRDRLAALQQPQINPQEQPVEYLANEQKQTREMLADMQRRQQEQEQRQQQEIGMQRFAQAIQADEQAFAKENSDYMQAVAFAKERKASEYRAFGYSDQEVQEFVQADAISIAQRALQLGESPARLVYEYAKTVGFKPQVSAEKKLGMMEAGQKAAKPSSSGGKDSATLSLEQLASMNSDDFSKITDAQFKKLMGG